jgi:hypothetical protein
VLTEPINSWTLGDYAETTFSEARAGESPTRSRRTITFHQYDLPVHGCALYVYFYDST